ncbi:TIM barrel protein [Acidicapsa dinghuensis]|uniref:TIM barrel protein n=1 Tax=Acidicapsa dinghuensis TaxID=2218256 RepID=A0ABW1EFQ8_9BACT|nr:TIM barrel protein [Acidicapsa dinghuensis]
MHSVSSIQENAFQALDSFQIEIPSWGFANTGTRFGKFLQPAAASTLEEKFSDAGMVHKLTGITPTMALHVLWDLPNGLSDAATIKTLEKQYNIASGSINPNLFQDQEYKFGSLCNPSAEIRGKAFAHLLDSVAIARELGSRDISLWMPDGSNYPGTQSMRRRIEWLEEALQRTHAALAPNQRLLIEYKPFEPAFYHTDIADWGMAAHLAMHTGPQAVVLVDTGHHYAAQNIEQIVTWLLHLNLLGGFHFNDRRYADDDLTLGSIDPYQIFRIFHEIHLSGPKALLQTAFMIDQSHNLKGKMEAMIQTVATAQELWLKAALVDREALAKLQTSCDLISSEELFRDAFWTDVRPLVREWRRLRGLPEDPLAALKESGYVDRIARERGGKLAAVSSYA